MIGDDALIVIPTYNERENADAIANAVHRAAPGGHILFVDDNSPDGTGAVLDELMARDDRVFVLHRPEKAGLGTAYLDGFRWGLLRPYQRFVEMDADFSHDPSYLPDMLGRSAKGMHVVVGSRYVSGGGTANWGFGRRALSRGAGLYARQVLGVPVRDMTAGFVCWQRKVLETLDLGAIRSQGYGFQIEMKYRAVKAGFALEEMPIVFVDRRVGRSKMSKAIVIEALTMVWRLRFFE